MFINIRNRIGDPIVRKIAAAAVYDHSEPGMNQWETRIRGRESWQLYAWIEHDEILGVCGFVVHTDFIEILTIAVSENARGRGVGRAMVSSLQERYKLTIKAETDDDAIGFYRKCGFEATAIRKYNVQRWTCVLTGRGATMITLLTDRLVIREYRETDLPEYHKLLSDKQNMYYLNDIATGNLQESQKSLQEAITANHEGRTRRLCITLGEQNDDKLIGSIGYDIIEITPVGKIGHMGWFIMPEYGGKGYITEAAKRVLSYAFLQDDCVRITTGCYSENKPTQRVMEKVGFRKEGERIQAVWHDGRMKDRTEFAMNRDEFQTV